MFNSFGHLYRVTTWGESHGQALGAVIDGRRHRARRGRHPALARRPPPGPEPLHHPAPGPTPSRSSPATFEGRTTGAPISLAIRNTDQRSKDYGDIAQNHAPATPTSPTTSSTVSATTAGGLLRPRDGRPRRRWGRRPRRPSPPSRRRSGSALVQIGDLPVDRAAWDWDEVPKPLLVPRRQGRRRLGHLPRLVAQIRQLGRRDHRARRRRACLPASAPRSTPSSTATSRWR